MPELPQRRRLYHAAPPWVKAGAMFFVTVCAEKRGRNSFANQSVGPALINSAVHYHATGVWWLRLLVLMPDHVHALVAVGPERQLGTVLTAWKSFQRKKLGILWQTGFFDHRLRNEESLDEKVAYIRMNPVRAGLVKVADEWPYRWEP